MKEERKSQEEILYNFFYTLFKRKYLALAIFLSTFAGIIFGTYLVGPMWKATAKVRVQYNPKQQLTMFEGITTPGAVVSGVNPANDVIQMVTSRELAEEVVKKYGRDKLVEQKETAPESSRDIIKWHMKDFLIGRPISLLQWMGILTPTPDNYLAMAVEEFQEDLTEVEIEEDTTVVNISIWGESPEISTSMANTLVQLLLETNLQSSREPIDEAIKATKTQLFAAEENLAEAQDNLRDFKEESALVLYNEEASILLQRLDKYTADLDDMEGRMAALRTEKSTNHPEVQSLAARIQEYRDVIIPGIRTELKNLPLKEVELARLDEELKVRQELYSRLKQKLLDLEAFRNSSMGDLELKVIDKARVYSFVKPDWPKWVINIPLGLIGSVFAALMFIFFVEYWNSSFKSVKDLEERVSVPVLGSFPKLGHLGKRTLPQFLQNSDGHIGNEPSAAESNLPMSRAGQKYIGTFARYHLIADSLQLDNKGHDGKVYVIASPGREEGKSIITAVLGQIFAKRNKKVLIIEANLRTPSMARAFDIQIGMGLVDCVLGDMKLEDVTMNVAGMDMVLAGKVTHEVDPFELLASEKMEAFLKDARTKYDVVFLDSPCIKSFKDPLVLAALSDDTVLVVAADQTPMRSVIMAIDKIVSVGGRIKGVVLNKQTNYVPEFIREII